MTARLKWFVKHPDNSKGTYVKSYCYKTMEAKTAKTRHVVLIVEDEPLVRVAGADLLAKAGFEVLEAGNADEALRILEAAPEVRVVFSDVEMPGSLDGLGLARTSANAGQELEFS
ncbi:MAG: response regulator [Methylocella sp.]